jgi:hypothetical protein
MSSCTKIVTLGVYGFDQAGFFGALQHAGVQLFCDLRFRRGLRGRLYAFANSRLLQTRLAERGIAYLHCRDLAPSPELRRLQTAADKQARVLKRQRLELSPGFIAGYERERLALFNSAEFLSRCGVEASVIALFCVEREPVACHRGLVAERLRKDLGVEVAHLVPR